MTYWSLNRYLNHRHIIRCPQEQKLCMECVMWHGVVNDNIKALRPRQNGRHVADDIFKCIFLNENVWIPIKISLKFVAKGRINNIPALVQIMARRRPGDKPLSEPMMVSLPTHICVIRPQWVNPRRNNVSILVQIVLGVIFVQLIKTH